jgi:hypothetical protein
VNLRTLSPLAVALGLCVAGISSAQEIKLLSPANETTAKSNQELANAVAAQLQMCGLRGYTIDISCTDGVVELSGRIADKFQHDQVVRTVFLVPGVKSVADKLIAANFEDVRPVQAITPGQPGMLPPPVGNPIVDPIPVGQPGGAMMNDLNPPKMPPYAWPTYAPYNNYSRVAYPSHYPYNAWPFIGPFYPFPKVPLGWRSVTLEWQDGHWYMGRNGTKHDYWRVRYW